MVNFKVALVGMPGCGKTTLGKMLSEKIDLELIDLDEFIVEEENKSIDELFKIGEDVFRKAESNSLEKVALRETPVILSTGGGIVKIQSNINILKENFLVIFIDREIDDIFGDIDTNSRPLLKNNKNALINLYNERYSLYKKASSIQIKNKGSIEKVLDEIVKEILNYKLEE